MALLKLVKEVTRRKRNHGRTHVLHHRTGDTAVTQTQALEVLDGVEVATKPAAALWSLHAAGNAGHAQLVIGIVVEATTVALQDPGRHLLRIGAERHGGK